MQSTKRRFHQLMQGLSEPSNKSPGGQSCSARADEHDSLQKRRRLGLSPSVSLPKSTNSSPARPHSSNASPKPSRQEIHNSASAPLAKYCPSDRAELLRRLGTFQEITDWTPKPDHLSDIHWARRGWICKGKDRVRCVLCQKELVVRLSPDKDRDRTTEDSDPLDPGFLSENITSSDSTLENKYAELMVTSHQEECLWRKRGCDEHLLRLSLANAKITWADLGQRYAELLIRAESLPQEANLRLPPDFDLDNLLSRVRLDFGAQTHSGSQLHRVALALALCGWQGLEDRRIGPIRHCVSCHSCLRRLGLWIFKDKEAGIGNITSTAPMDHLDPIWEHRFFCPWKNAETQRRAGIDDSSERLPAWSLLIRTIHNDAQLRRFGLDDVSSASDGQLSEAPSTPVRADSAAMPTSVKSDKAAEEVIVDNETKEDRDRAQKDKDRWARLKKVKSLLDLKSGKRVRRPDSVKSSKSFVTPEP